MPKAPGQKELTLANLHTMDGGNVGLAFDHVKNQVVADCQDRPGDKTPRKIKVEVVVKPVLRENTAQLDHLAMHVKVDPVLPARRNSEAYRLAPGEHGQALFQPAAPLDPNQQAFDFDPETGEVLDETPTDADAGDE